jgi:hypothetical protein
VRGDGHQQAPGRRLLHELERLGLGEQAPGTGREEELRAALAQDEPSAQKQQEAVVVLGVAVEEAQRAGGLVGPQLGDLVRGGSGRLVHTGAARTRNDAERGRIRSDGRWNPNNIRFGHHSMNP